MTHAMRQWRFDCESSLFLHNGIINKSMMPFWFSVDKQTLFLVRLQDHVYVCISLFPNRQLPQRVWKVPVGSEA